MANLEDSQQGRRLGREDCLWMNEENIYHSFPCSLPVFPEPSPLPTSQARVYVLSHTHDRALEILRVFCDSANFLLCLETIGVFISSVFSFFSPLKWLVQYFSLITYLPCSRIASITPGFDEFLNKTLQCQLV